MAAAAAPQPALPTLDFDGHKVCAPVQRSLADIPIICFDCATRKVSHYEKVMSIRTGRYELIGPATLNGAAITSLENPQNKEIDPVSGNYIPGTGGSHHIMQCYFSRQQRDNTLAVQLLFNDGNGYMTAKRVRENGAWGNWQKFSDLDKVKVPSFLNAVDVDIAASHDEGTTIGGFLCLESMFYGLVGPVENKKAATLAVRRAIILFSEALRFRSILLEIVRRFIMNEYPSVLGKLLFARIGSWKVLSRFLIELAKFGSRVAARLALKLPSFTTEYELSSFEEVREELLVVLYSEEFLLTSPVQKILACRKTGMGVKDPKFARA